MMIRKKERANSNVLRGLIAMKQPSSAISEQFRTLCTNIQFSMVNRKLQSLAVTSAAAGAGKSTIASNLAVTFAGQGKKVLLVDTDLRRSSVHKTFGLPNYEGLTTLLTSWEMNTKEMIQQTEKDNLFCLTSGPIPPNPAELLGSTRMTQLMEELKEEYDLIIFDLPPVVAITDAQIVASKTDGTAVVVPKGRATKDELIKAKTLLDIVHANILGVVFNRVKDTRERYYYYSEEQ